MGRKGVFLSELELFFQARNDCKKHKTQQSNIPLIWKRLQSFLTINQKSCLVLDEGIQKKRNEKSTFLVSWHCWSKRANEFLKQKTTIKQTFCLEKRLLSTQKRCLLSWKKTEKKRWQREENCFREVFLHWHAYRSIIVIFCVKRAPSRTSCAMLFQCACQV